MAKIKEGMEIQICSYEEAINLCNREGELDENGDMPFYYCDIIPEMFKYFGTETRVAEFDEDGDAFLAGVPGTWPVKVLKRAK